MRDRSPPSEPAPVLFSWMGSRDFRGLDGGEPGPVALALGARRYSRVELLDDYGDERSLRLIASLGSLTAAPVSSHAADLKGNANDFGRIYEAALRAVASVEEHSPRIGLTFHLSPGTPAMSSVWVILAKTRFRRAELIEVESTGDRDVRTVEVPFEMSAEFLEDYFRPVDRRLRSLTVLSCLEAPEFEEIRGESEAIRTAIFRARRIAPLSIDVLIEGESGTGKELFARAIHRASPRRDAAMVAVNCGAIPKPLIESELFGHEAGAHSTATRLRMGKFEAANGSTLFLDEIGELSAEAQVALLRVLQEKEVTRLGATKGKGVDVRVIAATNRDLAEEVRRGRFRSDLYYRLARVRLRLPPLRERAEDVRLLAQIMIEKIRQMLSPAPLDRRSLELTPDGMDRLLRHPWPGNVRELENTLTQAAVWAPDGVVRAQDIDDALVQPLETEPDEFLDRGLGHGFSLEEVLLEVKRGYLARALEEADGIEARAAELLGLTRQTLSNWLREAGLKKIRRRVGRSLKPETGVTDQSSTRS